MASPTEKPAVAPAPTAQYVRDGSIVGGDLYNSKQELVEKDYYKKIDMPVAAVFESVKKAPLIHLIPFREIHGQYNEIRRVEGSGLRIKFQFWGVQIWNSHVLKMMLDPTRGLLDNDLGYHIDPLDPTGFWRSNGIIQVQMVPTYRPSTKFEVRFDKLNLKPEIPEDLVTLQPLTIG